MKFLSLSSFAIGALAQGIYLTSPPPGSVFTLGQSFVVTVVRPNFIQRATEVGLVIGLAPCLNGGCPPPSVQVGTVLYNGPYDPEYHGIGQQYQNFTVTVPNDYPWQGPSSVQVARFFLIGAGSSPTIGEASVPVIIHH